MDVTLNRPVPALAAPPVSRGGARWPRITGRVLTGVVACLLTLDSVGKLLRVPEVIDGTAQLGYSPALVVPIGILALICVVVYVVPSTSFLGAVLLTGYLGGAVATHVRVGNPLLTHVLSPVYVGVVIWAGLLLRRPALRAQLFGGGEA